jgi:segregation and condensation protein A
MELAGEFLEMAARLIYMKTVSLFPSQKEADELKTELTGRLIEYSLCKAAAAIMKERYADDAVTVRQALRVDFDNTYPLFHESAELLAAYAAVSAKLPDRPLRSEIFSEIVSRKLVTVTSKIIRLLRILYKDGLCFTAPLFGGLENRSERVAMLLAVLELAKTGRISLNDDNTVISLRGDYVKQTASRAELTDYN